MQPNQALGCNLFNQVSTAYATHLTHLALGHRAQNTRNAASFHNAFISPTMQTRKRELEREREASEAGERLTLAVGGDCCSASCCLLCLLCLSKQLEDCLARLPWLVCHWLRLLNLIMSQISKSFFPLLLSSSPFLCCCR